MKKKKGQHTYLSPGLTVYTDPKLRDYIQLRGGARLQIVLTITAMLDSGALKHQREITTWVQRLSKIALRAQNNTPSKPKKN